MFNNEHLPIHRTYTARDSAQSTIEIAEQLRHTGALYMELTPGPYLFTTADLPLLESQPASSPENFVTAWAWPPSISWTVDESLEGIAAIVDAPAPNERPVVFRSPSGAVIGFALPAELLHWSLGAARQLSAYFHSLAETVADAVTVVDHSGRVVCWNATAEEVYGIPRQDILGRRIGEHFEPDALMILRILDEGRRIRSTYHRPRPGTHVLINAAPILDEHGRIIGGAAAERDITSLVRMNEELSTAASVRPDAEPRPGGDPFAALSGRGEAALKAVGLARKVAAADNPLLIVGETGVGKERFAKTIHAASRRADAPCLVVHCGAVPAGLLDAELFGYQGGAFTGSGTASAGKLELADGGTLFIDEIDGLPLDTQAKLYQYMQSHVIVRSGGTAPIPVHTRIIAASPADLLPLVERGAFRADLYYTLNVITVALPPLRESKEDIPALIQLYLREFALQYGKPLPQVTPEAQLALMNYDWPGNLRELRNIVERCVILSEDERITHDHLPHSIQAEQPLDPALQGSPPVPRDTLLRSQQLSGTDELQLIQDALAKTLGNKSAAAKLLGVSRGTLYNKLKEYQFE